MIDVYHNPKTVTVWIVMPLILLREFAHSHLIIILTMSILLLHQY
jgi:hypothetical protein